VAPWLRDEPSSSEIGTIVTVLIGAFVTASRDTIMTSEADRRLLLQLARDAIACHIARRAPPVATGSPVLTRRAGVFVTLHSGEMLRGCIGHIQPDQPLAQVVPTSAVAAATSDPRFAPVTIDELAGLEIEISIMGDLERIQRPADLEIGSHGLLVEDGWHRGLLLPQVATEWSWDAETFLGQTCHKAGLPLDAWRTGALIWRFEAEVFSERRPNPEAPSGS
jgi:AmmeMemoRadiSam system protein A